jgi:hypothetical protein
VCLQQLTLTPTASDRLNLSTWLINHGTLFFSHKKLTSAGLSAAKTISRIAHPWFDLTLD